MLLTIQTACRIIPLYRPVNIRNPLHHVFLATDPCHPRRQSGFLLSPQAPHLVVPACFWYRWAQPSGGDRKPFFPIARLRDLLFVLAGNLLFGCQAFNFIYSQHNMIGIFDSGIGGMTVARAVENLLPGLPIRYFGDLARTPYGSKSDAAILDYSIENTEFLLKQGATVIVIACNSAASVATERLRADFSVPIIEVISPAVEEAVACTHSGRLGIIGTSATIRNNRYERQIHELRPDYTVYSQPCPLLVPLVEEGWLDKRETKMILRRYLHPLKDKQIDTLVLGCTHYPLLKHLIQPRVGRRVHLIDSSEAVARHLKKFLHDHPGLVTVQEHPPEHHYFVSDLTVNAQQAANSIFQRHIELITA